MQLKSPSRQQSAGQLGCQRLGSRAKAGKPAGEKALSKRSATLQIPGEAMTLLGHRKKPHSQEMKALSCTLGDCTHHHRLHRKQPQHLELCGELSPVS